MKPSRRSLDDENRRSGRLGRTISCIAAFYDECKVGHQGVEGYRKSTDLNKLGMCVYDLLARGLVDPKRTNFLDLGCADGRVNVLLSYFVKRSIGVELDPEILAEYGPRAEDLRSRLKREGHLLWPDNITLFQGSSLDESVHQRVYKETGVLFSEMDLFYTYITLHDRFADRIARDAKPGALYLVYGFNRVLPRYSGLDLLIRDVGDQGIAALYAKASTARPSNPKRT